ncbi:MAG TPA: tetratricopeptide repeat protein [Sediminispirochaeta sp.]|mgnify:CR=1 FL=1|nr:tetratricopeptide repeat protein [Sediminispirochaeta sp.]
MKNKIIFISILSFFAAGMLWGQDRSLPPTLHKALSSFEKGEFESSVENFRAVLVDSDLSDYYGDAYYWLGRSYLAMEDVDKAARNIDFFLNEYPDHRLTPEARYYKGRILFFQQEFEKSIQQLNSFIEGSPEHSFVANAYFWIGECFYHLGHFEKAEQIYDLVLRDYPRSYKVEAARYRRSLIELKQREQELLRLLRISHEEYLKTIEDFQRREKEYQQALSNYQRRLSSASRSGDESQDEHLQLEREYQDDLKELQESLRRRDQRIAELERELRDARRNGGAPVVIRNEENQSEIMELLALKDRALENKLFLIQWLDDHEGEGK